MEIKPIYFFSIVKNVTTYCKKEKEIDLDTPIHPIAYQRQKEHIQQKSKYIWNEYENGKFTITQFKLYVLYKNLFQKSFFILNVNVGEIKNVATLFTKGQFEKDKMVILGVCKSINIKNINEFLKFKKDGENNVAEDLVKRQIISPIILIKYHEKIEYQDLKLKKIIIKIKQILEDKENG